MPEGIPNQEPDKLMEKSILPVSKDAVDKSLVEIAQNPLKVMIEEGRLIRLKNPALFDKLTLVKNTLGENDFSSYFLFQEGASYTYRILRKQAENLGTKLPVVSDDVVSTFFQEQIQYISEIKEEDRREYFAKQIERISIQDPEFGRAMKEFIRYRALPENFYFGAISVYLTIKNSLQAEELERKFNAK